MPSRFRQIHLVATTLVVLAFVPILSAVAFAGDPPAAGATQEDKGSASEKATGTDRVYVLNGATITWDLDRQRFRPPTAAEAASLAQQFREWTEAKLGNGEAPFTKEVVVEELAGGMRRARVPIYLMNATTVSVGPDGEMAPMCTEGPAGAAEALALPAAPSAEVWR